MIETSVSEEPTTAYYPTSSFRRFGARGIRTILHFPANVSRLACLPCTLMNQQARLPRRFPRDCGNYRSIHCDPTVFPAYRPHTRDGIAENFARHAYRVTRPAGFNFDGNNMERCFAKYPEKMDTKETALFARCRVSRY